jgi:hypothetical protein
MRALKIKPACRIPEWEWAHSKAKVPHSNLRRQDENESSDILIYDGPSSSLMKAVFGVGFAAVILFSLVPTLSFAADTHGILALEESVIPMSISPDNNLPWGFIEGKVTSPAQDHPVIIQIYKGQEPVHFAQVAVSDDGTYQYRFRVLDVTDGKTTRIFDGDYTVRIFKVVNLDSEYLDSYLQNKYSSLVSVFF